MALRSEKAVSGNLEPLRRPSFRLFPLGMSLAVGCQAPSPDPSPPPAQTGLPAQTTSSPVTQDGWSSTASTTGGLPSSAPASPGSTSTIDGSSSWTTPDATTTSAPQSSVNATTSSEGTPSSSQSSATATSETEDPEPTPPTQEVTSAALLATFDLGWNLGNSLDVPDGETAWGNPTVDASLFEAVAEAGFDIVRIPVTWSAYTGAGPDFTIDADRLNRVEEVIRYALDAGLYAIINLHHDGADDFDGVEWLTLTDSAGSISDANNSAVEARFRAVWSQLAQRYAAIDHHLLFESMNEIHDGYDAPKPEYYGIINRLNQAFVDIVRQSGSYNTTRHLVVPGYNTNIDYTLAGFEPPADTVADRLILSVHYYDPWSFAGEGSTHAWGEGSPGADSWGQEQYVTDQFDKLKATYIDTGLPMIMGEYGAINQAGAEKYRRYYMEYVTQAACERGIVPIYWDNGGSGSGPDSFGLFERTSKEVLFPDILEAMFRGCLGGSPLSAIAKP